MPTSYLVAVMDYGSTDWRTELWMKALIIDNYISNKSLGDGLEKNLLLPEYAISCREPFILNCQQHNPAESRVPNRG